MLFTLLLLIANTDTMETRFKVGDRVTDSSFGNGTVVHFDDEMYVVDFDESKVGLNDCNGHSKNGQGLWIREKYLTSETVAERNNRLIREMQSTPLTFVQTDPEPSRAMIAAMCLQGFISNGEWDGNVIEVSVQYADQLIAELQKPRP
jgi:hypothetical protein